MKRLQDHRSYCKKWQKQQEKQGFDMPTDLVDRLFQQNGNFDCYMGKSDASKRENYGGLKLTDQILKIVYVAIEKLIRQEKSIDEMQLGFMPGYRTTNAIFILR